MAVGENTSTIDRVAQEGVAGKAEGCRRQGAANTERGAMTTWTMTTEEHVATARTFLEQSEREFTEGDILQGSEKLWGAVSHATSAAAKQRGWPTDSHRDLVNAARGLAEEKDDRFLDLAFRLARNFHTNFYGNGHFNPFREPEHLNGDRDIVTEYIHRVLAIVAEGPSV